ncbi:MAG: hypothetical protein ACO20H_00455 [Bacteriovoracaceae bacterium]
MEESNLIKIRGAKTHNLKNLDLDIKINKISCFAGPSGSGKTSLAFHTLYLESKRRLINSFPTQVKFFWDIPQTVDVDHISPVLPVWGIKQSNPILGSRLNFSDLINITEELQKLFFLESVPVCPEHKLPLIKEELNSKIKKAIKDLGDEKPLSLLCLKADYLKKNSGILPSRSFHQKLGPINLEDPWWEIVRLKGSFPENKIDQILEKNLEGHFVRVGLTDGEQLIEIQSSAKKKCSECKYTLEEIWEDLSVLSPFNPLGACKTCKGHGNTLEYDHKKLIKHLSSSLMDQEIHLISYAKFSHYWKDLLHEAKKKKVNLEKPIAKFNKKEIDFLYKGAGTYPGFNDLLSYLESKKYKKNVRIYLRGLQSEYICGDCQGTRLDPLIQYMAIFDRVNILKYQDVFIYSSEQLLDKLQGLSDKKDLKKESKKILRTIINKLSFVTSLGLEKIVMHRKAKTLTSGEYQKSILVKVLSYEGSGSLFVLDEPSLGMDKVSQKQFMGLIKKLNKQGNTIIIIDHSDEIQRQCDEIILLGPEAGDKGGQILYQGPYQKRPKLKVQALKKEPINSTNDIIFQDIECLSIFKDKIKIKESAFNLVTGSSGKGKSSIILKALANEIHSRFYGEKYYDDKYKVGHIEGLKSIDDYHSVKIFEFKPSKGNSRSTIGTKLGVSSFLRDHFAQLDVSKALGLKAGHFSPNSPLGKCTHCEGAGEVEVDMNFIENLKFTCPECKGGKIRPMFAKISDGKFLASEAFSFSLQKIFQEYQLSSKLTKLAQYITLLKLDYLQIDRKLSTLSGGEQQRFNFLSYLNSSKGRSLLFFENLSFGLGPREITDILILLQKLVAQGHTVVAIDQNPLFRKVAQNTIDFS